MLWSSGPAESWPHRPSSPFHIENQDPGSFKEPGAPGTGLGVPASWCPQPQDLPGTWGPPAATGKDHPPVLSHHRQGVGHTDAGTQRSPVSMATDSHAPQERKQRHSDIPVLRAHPPSPLPPPWNTASRVSPPSPLQWAQSLGLMKGGMGIKGQSLPSRGPLQPWVLRSGGSGLN